MPTFGDIILTATPYIIGFLIALIGFLVYSFSKQKKLMRFFGVDRSSRCVMVYLSSLLVPRGGSTGFDGLLRSYQGIAIPTGELTVGSRLAKALTTDSFEYLSPIVRKSLQKRYAFFRPMLARIDASPMRYEEIDFSTRSIITVGSQAYNIVSNYCMTENLVQLQITHNGAVIEVMKGRDMGQVVRKADDQHDIAILEKIIDHDRNNSTIIVAAGLGVIGTMGAIQYLIDHWHELQKTYDDQDFALALQFGHVGKSSLEDILRNGSIIYRSRGN
jgi:hypothetical protein